MRTGTRTLCTVAGNLTLAGGGSPVGLAQPLLVTGTAGGGPPGTLNLGGSSVALFSIRTPNASVTIRGLQLTAAALPESFPLPADVALRDAWEVLRSRPDASTIGPSEGLKITHPLIIAGATPGWAGWASTAPGAATAGAALCAAQSDGGACYQPPPTCLDLRDTSWLLQLDPASHVQLHNLIILNPPLGTALQCPFSLMVLPLWTFGLQRLQLGKQIGSRWVLVGRGLAIALPGEELALWNCWAWSACRRSCVPFTPDGP
ncbi:hypothetical protein GPECTOR_46g231 [Gonium pectorale]|uniref:Uncharacterized protein n=1 Tax=Gonium pectorale TaxID=33097 RepID=A0A150G8I8_GONPE|nr:hypothetical protein GPECTOR_46g231 [Gonium pectorale]|eukprot:KXZ46162.1 hypothetical protein GPECTOR_46g231 [Gonium pectorale]